MARLIPVNKGLYCGCCGEYFRTWEGYEDQDQDDGYGICKKCQGWIGERNRAEEDKMIATLRSGLNPENQAKFDEMDRDLQMAMVYQALEDGVMTIGFKLA